MKRVTAFLSILIASILSLIVVTIVGISVFSSNQTNQNPNGWMSQMWSGMGGMMGQTGTTGTAQVAASPLLPYFGVLFAVLIAVTVVGVVGVGYYLVFPQIRMGAVQPAVQMRQSTATVNAYESVLKTLTEEERKVIRVLNAHEGKYLQKYIKSETGLSRLKTHRIVARLADRDIVTLEKSGNTNQVQLANWLSKEHSAF
jgi:predicted transcriptional regulator